MARSVANSLIWSLVLEYKVCATITVPTIMQQRACEQGEAGAGTEQPERAAAVAKLRGRENVDIREICLEPTADAFHVGAGSNAHEKIRGLVRRRSRKEPPPIERREHIWRGRE